MTRRHEASAARYPALCYCAPKFWPTWLLLGWMRAAALLPMRWNLKLHRRLGRVAARLLARRAHVARRNLELCFPALPADRILALLRSHIEALATGVGETGAAWFAPVERAQSMLDIEGREHLDVALARGRGVLLYTGHFTSLEISGPLLGAVTTRFTFMYSRRRNKLLDAVQARGRTRVAQRSFPKDDVRSMLRSLRDNFVVWYAADQHDEGKSARLVPFFAEPAMTSTAICRLARISGAAVVPFYYRRRADDAGYVLTFHAPLGDFPSDDAVADTRRLVALTEQAILRAPEQYMWTQKKFRGRPQSLPDAYARPPRGPAKRRAWTLIGAAAGALALWLSGLLDLLY